MYQQGPQISIALTRDPSEPLFTTARALSGSDAERGGVAAAAVEDVWVAHARDQRRCGLRSDRLDLHEAPCRLTGGGERTDLLVVCPDSSIEVMKLLEQSGKDLAIGIRQGHVTIEVERCPRPLTHAA
jgi:hypothetical protein